MLKITESETEYVHPAKPKLRDMDEMKLREGNPNQTESPNYFDLFTLVCEVIMT
jgi:hypothetical protein